MNDPRCQWRVGTQGDGMGQQPPCRAMAVYEVATIETVDQLATGPTPMRRGWFGMGDYCEGHAVTLVGVSSRTRAMRPLPATYEVRGKR